MRTSPSSPNLSLIRLVSIDTQTGAGPQTVARPQTVAPPVSRPAPAPVTIIHQSQRDAEAQPLIRSELRDRSFTNLMQALGTSPRGALCLCVSCTLVVAVIIVMIVGIALNLPNNYKPEPNPTI